MTGIIKSGFFPLLLSKVIKWSDLTSRSLYSSPSLFIDEVESQFGDQRFTVRVDRGLRCYEVVVEGVNPLPVYNVLVEQIGLVVKESMNSLNFVFMVKYIDNKNNEIFINVDHRNSLKENKTTSLNINVPGSNSLVPFSSLKELLQHWISDTLALPWYDSFLSYRWGKDDSVFVKTIVSSLDNYKCVGVNNRAIRNFLDTNSLSKGADFKEEFVKALLTSTVAFPIVSHNALVRMLTHDPNGEVDNLMIEWIIMLLFVDKLSESPPVRLVKVCPIMLGKIVNDKVTNLFSEGITKEMKATKPVATISRVEELLTSQHIPFDSAKLHSFTVKSIVDKMLDFNGFSMWEVPDQSRRALHAADEVVNLVSSVFRQNPSMDKGVEDRSPSPVRSSHNNNSNPSPVMPTSAIISTTTIIAFNPTDSIELWLADLKLTDFVTFFKEELEIKVVSDLILLKNCNSLGELEVALDGSGMKKPQMRIFNAKLTNLQL